MSSIEPVVPGYAKDFLIFIETEVVLKVNGRAEPQITGYGNLGIFLYEKDAGGETEAIGLHPIVVGILGKCR